MSAAPIIRDYVLHVLDRREKRGVRGIYHERNRWETHVWKAPFAGLPITELRKRHVREWIDIMQATPARRRKGRLLSTDTVKRHVALVSAVCTEAVREEILETNPCRGIEIFKRADEIGKDDPWTFLTIDEQRAIAACDAIPLADRLMIAIAIGTGLRQGEMYHLPKSLVYLDGSEPLVHVKYGRENLPPKNGRPRKVSLLPHVTEAFRAWLSLLPNYAPDNPREIAFPRPDGSYRASGKPLLKNNQLRKHLALVGITRPVRWHDLRHTCASSLVSGVWGRRWTLEEIMPVMGHSDIKITQRYAHIGQSVIAAAARETRFTDSLIVPPGITIVRDEIVPPANDTAPDLSVWWDEAVAS